MFSYDQEGAGMPDDDDNDIPSGDLKLLVGDLRGRMRA
jgi:hypothetical protein